MGRAEADRRWLEPKAVRIQRAVRGIIARRSMGQAGGERTYMVTKIQRLWRGVFARMVCGRALLRFYPTLLLGSVAPRGSLYAAALR